MKKIRMNFLYNILYQLLLILTPLISAPYISRVLGPSNTGIYSYTYSIVSYFVLCASLGMKNYGNRTIAYVRNDKENLSKTFWSLYFFQLIVSAISLIGYLFFLFYFAEDNKFIYLIQTIYIFAAILDISWFFFGLEEFKLTTIRSSLVKIVSLLLIFLLVKSKSDLWIYCLIMGASMLLGQITFWPFVPRFVKFYRPSFQEIKSHFKPNLILFIPVLAVSVYNLLDKVMLGNISGMTETGFFENAEKVVNIPFGIIMALGTVMLPRMSNLVSSGDIEQTKKYIFESIKLVMILSAALGCGIGAVAPVFAPLFFGNEFVKTGVLISLISPITLFKAWANVLRTQYLIPNKRDKDYIASVIIGAITNVLFNFILIPNFASIGAVLSTVLAEGIVCIYQTWVLRHELPIKKYIVATIPYIIFGIIMFLVTFYIGYVNPTNLKTLSLQIFIGGLIYSVLTGIYLVKSKDSILKLVR